MAQTRGLSLPQDLRNYLINGNMDLWQRNSTFASLSQYSYYPDRWANQSGANTSASISQQSLAGVQAATFAARWTAGSTSSQFNLTQPIESAIVNQMKGKYVTFSIYARINSGNVRTYSIAIYKNSTANVLSTGSWSAINTSTATTLTTSFQRLTVTALIPNDGTANGVRVGIFDNQTGLAADYIEIVGAMLNDGFSAAPNYLLHGSDIPGEIQACQRYYEKSSDLGTAPGNGNRFYTGILNAGGGGGHGPLEFKVTKRVAPSTVQYWNEGVANQVFWRRPGSDSTNTITFNNLNQNGFEPVNVTVGSAGQISQVSFAWAVESEIL